MNQGRLDIAEIALGVVQRIWEVLKGAPGTGQAVMGRIFRSGTPILARVVALALVAQLGEVCVGAATLDGTSSTPLTTDHWGWKTRSYSYHWTIESQTTCPVVLEYSEFRGEGKWILLLVQPLVKFPAWKQEIGIYPEDELVGVLEQTLTDFKKREPDARLDEVTVSLHLVPQMWTDFIGKFAPSIRGIRGESEGSHWNALRPRANAAVQGNPTVAKVLAALRRAGYQPKGKPRADGPDKSPAVEDGIEWKTLAKMPNAGLVRPCYLTIGVTTETKAAARIR